jgi:hypothetical protein
MSSPLLTNEVKSRCNVYESDKFGFLNGEVVGWSIELGGSRDSISTTR